MLRTNLATRPFYNERAVRLVLAAFATVVVALTLFNAIQLVRLTASQSRLGSQAANAEREAERLSTEAAQIRTQVDPKELEAVSSAAREANSIIDRRAFSWTDLFSRFETTLPPNVRIRAVQPRLDRGTFMVAVVAEARRVEDIDTFIEALESTGAFRKVRPVEEQTNDDGLLEAVVEGIYLPPARGTKAAKDE